MQINHEASATARGPRHGHGVRRQQAQHAVGPRAASGGQGVAQQPKEWKRLVEQSISNAIDAAAAKAGTVQEQERGPDPSADQRLAHDAPLPL